MSAGILSLIGLVLTGTTTAAPSAGVDLEAWQAFEKSPLNPIIPAITGEENHFYAASMMIGDDGEFLIWGKSEVHKVHGNSIWLVTTPNNLGWERVGEPENPVLKGTGVQGDFDSDGTVVPTVYREDGTYYMFYLGNQRNQKFSLGWATSQDGRSFKRRGLLADPHDYRGHVPEAVWISRATLVRAELGTIIFFGVGSDYDLRILSSPLGPLGMPNPILSPEVVFEAEGDEHRVFQPQVFWRNGRFWMLYTADIGEKDRYDWEIRLATSLDGKQWVRHGTVIAADTAYDSRRAYTPWLMQRPDGCWWLYYSSMGWAGVATVSLATACTNLFEENIGANS